MALDRPTATVVGTTLCLQSALVLTGIASARLLGPESRGWLALAAAIPVAISGIALLGFPSAVTYEVARGRDSGFESLRLIRGWVTVQLLVATVASLAISAVLFRDAPGSIGPWIVVVGFATALLAGYQYLMAILQGRGKFGDFNQARATLTLVYALWVGVLLFAVSKPSALLFAWGWALGAAVAVANSWRLARRGDPREKLGGADAKFIRSYGLRSFLGVRPPLETLNLDQLLIGIVGGPLILGLYVVGTALTNLPRFMAESIGMVAFPKVAGAGDRDGLRQARNALILTACISGAAVLMLGAVASVIVPWLFGESFRPAISVMRIMLAAAFLLSLRRIVGDLLRGFGSPTPSSIAEVAAIVVFIVLVIPLTRSWGADGAALTYTAAALVSTVFVAIAYVLRVRQIRGGIVDEGSGTDVVIEGRAR